MGIVIRTVPEPQHRQPVQPDSYWEGFIHSMRFDGKRLDVFFIGPNGKRPVVYFTPTRNSLLLRFMLRPGDHLRVEGVSKQGKKMGINTSLYGITDEEIEERREEAERQVKRYQTRIKLLEEGHSLESADRMLKMMGY
jgi:hypothetical protein